VRVASVAEGVVIVVEDAGPGVPDDIKEAIFEPFRQGSENHPSPGTGIGLALVARFAELHGGRAWVEDRQGGGASFHALLPRLAASPPGTVSDGKARALRRSS
jgi:signal transduction histidine kinase